jgi:EAL domain-containing protein (putative c-di-GMP-specific phosphodiesterase class I)
MSILKEACRQLRQWQLIFNTENPLTMSINLSGRQFAQKDLVENIRKLIRDAQIEPEYIRLEITESIVMENASAAIEKLKQLKSIGVQLSIDDFGTGYSSLSYLHRFPFDILKIDRSFVSRMNTDKDSLSIVETIITLAKKLGKSIVAEGIEKEEHKELLKSLSCDYGQGYLYSKPLNSLNAEEFLRNHTVSQEDGYQSATTLSQVDTETITNQYAM